MATANRFTTFRDPEETAAFEATKAAQAKRTAPKETRKVVVKPKVEQTQARPADVADGDEFEETNDRRTQTQSRRGGRPATAGGDRGRGGRGRGDRGGRGRGDMQRGGRGRGAGEREGGRRRYEGKPREDAHPMDRKSGTGRGKRDTQKGGHGKGNWGTDKAAADTAQKDAADVEEKKEETTGAAASAAADDTTQDKVEEKKVEEFEEVVEIQDVGMTLDDFLAQKSANSKGLLDKRAGGRAHEKQVTKGIEAGGNDKKRITTIDSKLTGKDTYGATAGSGAEFLGFSTKDDDDVGRGAAAGRGDRERRDRGPRQQRGGAGRGRRQGKIEVNDDQFPAL